MKKIADQYWAMNNQKSLGLDATAEMSRQELLILAEELFGDNCVQVFDLFEIMEERR